MVSAGIIFLSCAGHDGDTGAGGNRGHGGGSHMRHHGDMVGIFCAAALYQRDGLPDTAAEKKRNLEQAEVSPCQQKCVPQGQGKLSAALSVEAGADRLYHTMRNDSFGRRSDYSVEFFVCGLYAAGISVLRRMAAASYKLEGAVFSSGKKEQRAGGQKGKDAGQKVPCVKDGLAEDKGNADIDGKGQGD